MRIEREEIIAACEEGPDAVVSLVESLVATISSLTERFTAEVADLRTQVAALEEKNERLECENRDITDRVRDLEARLKMNSRNSSKPPSSDGFGKTPQQRKRTGKPPGGQKGHKGHTLSMVDDPSEIITHAPGRCAVCDRHLGAVKPEANDRRQVFDIPITAIKVTEHRCQVKRCPRCGSENRAAFPEGVTAKTQYGSNLKAVVSYLTAYQLIPLKRACELVSDLFGHEVCEATLLNISGALFQTLAPAEEAIRRALTCSPVLNMDETGMRIEGKTSWLHVASNDRLTFYAPHARRGRAAMEDIGILPDFEGCAVHDAFSSYMGYDCRHALCNAHLMRELTALEESGETWAHEMKNLLLDTYASVNKAKERGKLKLSRRPLERIEKSYDRILEEGFLKNPLPDTRGQPKRRGRKKKSKARNLLERLRDHMDKVLAFAYDFRVPFDNNLAERDIRMIKVQQKVSGTFRSWDGARSFCRIRGYISTAKKNSYPVITALRDAFEGRPFLPAIAEA
ncbi:MAG: IS66 family transposase [Actinomycetia bacterium]|nr:IS66 family transposase [Actinomycetes bacterium]